MSKVLAFDENKNLIPINEIINVTLPNQGWEEEVDANNAIIYKKSFLNEKFRKGFFDYDLEIGSNKTKDESETLDEIFANIIRIDMVDGSIAVYMKEVPSVDTVIKIRCV